jgi:hypothetical protein
MAPNASAGKLLSVTATAPNKQEYMATVDALTGSFVFNGLPPGTYVLTFSTTATKEFPCSVTTTVVAGATATPPIPLITHDNVARGALRWTVDGQAYSATDLLKIYSVGSGFSILGQSGMFDKSKAVNQVSLFVPEENENGKVFAGAGTYGLGGAGRVMPTGLVSYFLNGNGYLSIDYFTINAGSATGTLRLARYDAEQGIAAGTFEFKTLGTNGSVPPPNLPTQVTVSQGEFDITF